MSAAEAYRIAIDTLALIAIFTAFCLAVGIGVGFIQHRRAARQQRRGGIQ